MDQRNFNYWLHGLFELSDTKVVLSVRQLVLVKKHLALVVSSRTLSPFGVWLRGVLDTLETTGVLMLDPKTQIDANLSDMIDRRLAAEFQRVVDPAPPIDPSCRREECGHPRRGHTKRSVVVGEADHTACSVEECDCSQSVDEHRSRCERCGSWDGGLCVCYAR